MREQIESKVRKGNELNAEILGRYAEAYRQHQAILKGTLSRGAPDPDKLYVLVDDTLPKTYAGIQATHAVAEFLRANPQTGWKNGTLVVLKADLRTIARYGRNLSWTAFREPDLGNRLTAVAAFKPNDVSLRYFSLL